MRTHNVGNQPHVPLICPIATLNAATDNDDDNGNACKHERRYNTYDDVNNDDDDDDVSKQAKPSSYVGSLGRGCASLTASGAPEGEGIDELGGQLDQSPPHVGANPSLTPHSQRPSSGCKLPLQSVKADVMCMRLGRADPGPVLESSLRKPFDQYASTSTGADRGSVVGLDSHSPCHAQGRSSRQFLDSSEARRIGNLGVMSTTTWNTEVCGLADVRNDPNGVTLTAAPGSVLAEKSIPLAPTSVDPAGEPMAPGESVVTRGSDGSCNGSRVCCPDGSSEVICDIGGEKGSNTLEYRPVFAADPVFPSLPIDPALGSRYSPSCFIDVENEVFEFDGQEIIFDNGTNQLPAKAPGGM